MKIRLAKFEDAQTLFDWRNDALTREMSRNNSHVDWADHVVWLMRRLEFPGLHIAEVDGNPVATFRVDGDEISYTVAPAQRNNGVGLTMLRIARKMYGPLRAEIFSKNAASIKIAEKAGFDVVLMDIHHHCMR